MGGAFVALADDATAAEANPAGLIKLSKAEVSVHGRTSDLEIVALDLNAVTSLGALNNARLSDTPLRAGSRVGNAFASETQATFDHTATEVSYASYVRPFDGYTLSVYYQKSADFTGASDFVAFDDRLLDLYQTRQSIALALENLGLSAAFEAGDFVSIGFSFRYSRLDVSALQETRADYLEDLEFSSLGSGAGLDQVRALGIVDQRIDRETLGGVSSDVTFNTGILFNSEGRWSAGLVYKDGGEFEIAGTSQTFGCLSPGVAGNFTCAPQGSVASPRRIKVPDFAALGLAWRPSERFKLLLDLNEITYSDLPVEARNDPTTPANVLQRLEKVEDEIEIHFGGEYVAFVGSNRLPLTFRAGLFTHPDHDGFREIDSEELITTFGVGTVLMESLQIDLAAQFGEHSTAGIVSLVYRY